MRRNACVAHYVQRTVSAMLIAVLALHASIGAETVYALSTSASLDMSIAPPVAVDVRNGGGGTAIVTWQMPPYSVDAITKSIDGFIIQKKLNSEDDTHYTQAGVYYLPSGAPPSTMSYTVTGLGDDEYDFRVITLSKLTDRLNQLIQSRTDCTDNDSDAHKCKKLKVRVSSQALPQATAGGGGSSGNGNSSNSNSAASAAPAAESTPAQASESTPAPAAESTPAPAAESTPAPAAESTPAPAADTTVSADNGNGTGSSSSGLSVGSSASLSETLADIGSSLSNILGITSEKAPTETTPTIKEETVGNKDSDNDGLSDLLETSTYHTDPNKADTDDDGLSDGEEILEYGTDPLNPADGKLKNIQPKITNITDNKTLNDARPSIKGIAQQNVTLRLIAERADHSVIELGTVQSDASGKWLMTPVVELTSGNYTLKALDADGTVLDTKNITIDLAFVLPPPEITNTDAQKQDDQGHPIFNSEIPEFQGNTYYGSTVVANFQSLLMSTSIIADNPEGDFTIRPPKALEAGNHTLTLYAELPDGTRSPAKIVKFSVNPNLQDASNQPSIWLALLTMKNIVLVFLVLNFMFLLYETLKELQPKRPKRKFAI